MTKHLAVCILALAAASAAAQSASAPHQPTLTPQTSGTTQLLISVSAANDKVVWAGGTGGTYVVTTDGGNTWRSGVVKGAENLQFRDVQAVSDKVAYLLSIGNHKHGFRIYKTEDGGATWQIQFKNEDPHAFYDCFAFWSPERGLAHSDSYDGVFPDLRTWNGGATWESIAANMPTALPGEASFSSSGTCITTQGWANAWIVTGGSTTSRVLATRDAGFTWNAYATPFVSNPNAGAFSVAFRDPWNGVIGGGDLTNDAATQAATSHDGGRTWTLTPQPPVAGSIFALAYARGNNNDWWNYDERYARTVVITTETQPNFDSGAAAWSPDEGQTWYALPSVSGYWGLTFANPHAGWFVGNNGSILKISF